MMLVVDAGNARIKWALLSGAVIGPSSAIVHRARLQQAARELGSVLPERIDAAIVANVAGSSVASTLAGLLRRRYGIEPQFVSPVAEGYGIRCVYSDPTRLGVDRWVAMIAARAKVANGAPVCVIDAGTAVTFDAVVGAEGRHLGGLILPGPGLIAGALKSGTSDIGSSDLGSTRPAGLAILGTNTAAAVANAAWLAIAAALDRAVEIVGRELAARPVVFLTGGDGPFLQDWLASAVEYRQDLVLEGLAIVGMR